jgi:iron complex outermembrane receptor protein
MSTLPARGAALVAAVCAATAAHGQGTSRVEILGAPIPSAAASPSITVIRADELARAGVQTAEQAVRRIAANQSDKGLAQGVGELTGGTAEADLRGLGATKTLVLLNGRRLTNHAYDAGAVDLHAIPMSLVDRIEVLREGASALYGSGAIAGVINFILRRDLQGVELAVGGEQPQQSGGATANLSITAGIGDLAMNGVNLSTTLDLRRQQAISSQERSFAKSGVRRDADGKVLGFRTGSITFPGDLDSFNPTLADGCAPPKSIPDADGTSCRYDFMRDLDLLPQNEQSTWLTQATWATAPGQVLSLEYLRAQNQTTARQGPAPVSLFMPQSSPFWIAGRPAEDFDDLGEGGIANWLTAPAARRDNTSRAVAQRLLLSAQGVAADVEYSAALAFARSDVNDTLGRGHVNLARIQQGLQDGHINPFGAQGTLGTAVFRDAAVGGKLLAAQGDVTTFDVQVARSLGPLGFGGGPVSLSLGMELRREHFTFDVQPLASQTADPGFDLAVDTQGTRQAGALFALLQAPLTPTVALDLAARFDRFSDSGRIGSGKLGLRWQLAPAWLLRASLGTSYRVPTLYETHLPQQLGEGDESFDDPLLCPSGVPLPGLSAGEVCAQELLERTGGPAAFGQPLSSLRSETSRNAVIGLLFQPTNNLRLGIDFWRIELRDQIDQLPGSTIAADPARYASRFVRCSQLAAATREAIDACLNDGSFDPIAYVDSPLENLGNVRAEGIDLSLGLSSGPTAAGVFGISAEGSYITRYDSQDARGGPYRADVGRFAVDAPIFRWQHVAQASWMQGPWTGALSQRYLSGYTDQDAMRKVGSYSLLDASLTYTGFKNLSLSLGLKNLLDRQPPFSNQTETPQANYDPRYTDATGRAWWLRLVASFY